MKLACSGAIQIAGMPAACAACFELGEEGVLASGALGEIAEVVVRDQRRGLGHGRVPAVRGTAAFRSGAYNKIGRPRARAART